MLIDVFRNFANAPKILYLNHELLLHTNRQQPTANLRTKRLLQQNLKKGNGRWCHLVPAPENKRPSLMILCLVCTLSTNASITCWGKTEISRKIGQSMYLFMRVSKTAKAIISFVIFCPSVRMEQLGCHWM